MERDKIHQIISTAIEEIDEKLPKNWTVRDVVPSQLPNKVSSLIGIRRCGKTYLLYHQIAALRKKKVLKNQILYLNFEDDRLGALTPGSFTELIDGFYQVFPENHDRDCYFFLDEIQNVSDWPKVVRRLLDVRKNHVFITGSSAKLLSSEIATSLRGRNISTELWPYSFKEYLDAHQIKPPKIKGQRIQDVFQKHLRDYLQVGGFPEIQTFSIWDRSRILQDYVEVVVFRDIVERYNVTNITLIKHMIRALLHGIGGSFSIHKWMKDFKSQGLAVGKNTLYDYMDHIQDAYLIFSVPLFTPSIRRQAVNLKKIYAVDTGLVQAFTFHQNQNWGHLFENMIYLDLRRQGYRVFYYLTNSGYEVDFIAQAPDGRRRLIQVCWDPTQTDTFERETRALREAEAELGLRGELITPDTYIKNYGV